jgi:hypothetical protein
MGCLCFDDRQLVGSNPFGATIGVTPDIEYKVNADDLKKRAR